MKKGARDIQIWNFMLYFNTYVFSSSWSHYWASRGVEGVLKVGGERRYVANRLELDMGGKVSEGGCSLPSGKYNTECFLNLGPMNLPCWPVRDSFQKHDRVPDWPSPWSKEVCSAQKWPPWKLESWEWSFEILKEVFLPSLIIYT